MERTISSYACPNQLLHPSLSAISVLQAFELRRFVAKGRSIVLEVVSLHVFVASTMKHEIGRAGRVCRF